MAAQRISDEQLLEAVKKHGKAGASRVLGTSERNVHARMNRLKGTLPAAALEANPAPKGFATGAVSTLHGPEGDILLQWVKSHAGFDPQAVMDNVKAVLSDLKPLKPIRAPKQCEKRLMTVYPIGDQHVAMYSWAEETGADYDIKIAERLLGAAADHLVALAPASETGLIVNVGDYFHVDNLKHETSRSGNTLDVDTRYAAMIRSGTRMLRTLIDGALLKHRQVYVITAQGNHDDIGALWLALALSFAYEKNPRVHVDTKPGKFHYHRHGKTLIGVTHGDSVKLEQLGGVMSTDRAEDWGATTHRHWLTGHIHQRKVLELRGVMVESFRTLAPADAWAHGAGYRSGRDMHAIVFDTEHGEVARHRFDAGMLAS